MANVWTRLECEVVVEDYLNMLAAELRGERYSKAQHRRALQKKLQGRSEGSIEYKHQNISAILIRAGRIYICGYKPAWNHQALLEEVVLEAVTGHAAMLDALEAAFSGEQPATLTPKDWRQVFVPPPETRPVSGIAERRSRVPRHVNYAEREARNRALGEQGEAFVFALEQSRLIALGRQDLVADIEWTSRDRGDGAGYDIRSFAGETDDELFIEVKTTNAGKYQPFMISAGEVEFSLERADAYALYRVFEFSRDASIFRLTGAVQEHVTLQPRTYSARF